MSCSSVRFGRSWANVIPEHPARRAAGRAGEQRRDRSQRDRAERDRAQRRPLQVDRAERNRAQRDRAERISTRAGSSPTGSTPAGRTRCRSSRAESSPTGSSRADRAERDRAQRDRAERHAPERGRQDALSLEGRGVGAVHRRAGQPLAPVGQIRVAVLVAPFWPIPIEPSGAWRRARLPRGSGSRARCPGVRSSRAERRRCRSAARPSAFRACCSEMLWSGRPARVRRLEERRLMTSGGVSGRSRAGCRRAGRIWGSRKPIDPAESSPAERSRAGSS